MILGIETSTPQASLAIWDSESRSVVWEKSFTSHRAHNSVIFEPLAEALESWQESLTGIVVGTGPGTYSGVRVGIAVAHGISLPLGIPVCGMTSLEAWTSGNDTYRVVGDARRKSYFFAEVNGRQLQGEPELHTGEKLGELLDDAFSSGLSVFTADRSVAEHFEGCALAYPEAAILACRAADGGKAVWDSKVPLEPYYLRAPYITTPKKGKG